MNNTRIIKEIINQKLEKRDKNGDDYLVLKLDNEEVIFVFSRKVNVERWNWLEQGKEYNFAVEEGKNGNNLLVDFEIEVEN
ncbi:MAG: hypothetical protein I3275_05400 [Candidatus Moeniiplasma glomeromycotorum]|nr:hypothetical protein [Candidatus Moeniiplasma glomeromycotorum]